MANVVPTGCVVAVVPVVELVELVDGVISTSAADDDPSPVWERGVLLDGADPKSHRIRHFIIPARLTSDRAAILGR